MARAGTVKGGLLGGTARLGSAPSDSTSGVLLGPRRGGKRSRGGGDVAAAPDHERYAGGRPSSRAAVPPRMAMRSALLKLGVAMTVSTEVTVHGYG